MGAVEVQSVTFGDGMIEITYFEPEANKGEIQEARTILIPSHLMEEQIADLHDSAIQLVDEALVIKRNPPDRLVRGKR